MDLKVFLLYIRREYYFVINRNLDMELIIVVLGIYIQYRYLRRLNDSFCIGSMLEIWYMIKKILFIGI